MLYVEVDGHGRRLVLVHGFAQNRNCWGPIAADLAADHEVVRIDAPGHGRSSTVAADLCTGARLVGERAGHATYVGYSMGARLVLHLALASPALVEGVVLIGGTAGIADPAERAQRLARDEEQARALERDGLDEFLTTWLAQPLFAGLTDETRFIAARRENTVAGLAASLRLAGAGAQQPLWDRLAEIESPVLVVAGADDAKFSAEAARLGAAIGPNATVALISHAGHAPHLERPDACLATLRTWLPTTTRHSH